MLVAVKSDVETMGCRLSSMQLSRLCKQACKGRASQPCCEADLTGREEVGFQRRLRIFGYAQSWEGDIT